jgi:hypothetical protein
MVVTSEMMAAKFGAIFPHLDERQRRLVMGAEARALGHGGIRLVARAAGVREATVSLGVDELDAGTEPLGRARRPGGGRKRAADVDPGLVPALRALVEPEERGDPVSPLRWTTRPARKLADELTRQGHKVSADTVGDLLREEGFSLQGNAKTLEGTRHPDRDAQFRYISGQARAHQDSGDPVISVDTKKKELAGEFKNAGRQWRPKGQPAAVRTHDFPGDSAGSAIPYGIYDLTAGAGWVNAGTDHDTAAFAAESIRRWWKAAGSSSYPGARRLLITADAGGSNGYRTRAQRPAGPHVRQQVQVRLVLGQHHRPAGQLQEPGHDLGHHVIMVRVAAGSQPGPPPDRHQPHPPVQRARTDLRPAQVAADPGQGPRAGAGQQRGDPPGQPPPAEPGPPGPRPAGQSRCTFAVEPGNPAAHRGRVAVQQRRDLGRR